MKRDLVRQSHESIRKGSKSFSAAGYLLDSKCRDDVFQLYMWCRHCDDVIDNSLPSESLQRLENIWQQTQAAMDGESKNCDMPFQALANVFKKYGIPSHYPRELILGMKMDVEGVEYKNIEDLKTYCYRVAGVVGLMMAHIIGVSDERALRNACDLGIAMQLTNIARDVFTDYEIGRVYLPNSMLAEKGIHADNLSDSDKRSKVFDVVESLLNEADSYYASGDEGLAFLDWRTATSIQAARYIYSDIGRIIRKRKAKAWDERVYTSRVRKIFLVLKAIVSVSKIKLHRKATPWRSIPIQSIWRYE